MYEQDNSTQLCTQIYVTVIMNIVPHQQRPKMLLCDNITVVLDSMQNGSTYGCVYFV